MLYVLARPATGDELFYKNPFSLTNSLGMGLIFMFYCSTVLAFPRILSRIPHICLPLLLEISSLLSSFLFYQYSLPF